MNQVFSLFGHCFRNESISLQLQFGDEIKIVLPAKLNSHHHVLFTFYHLTVKPPKSGSSEVSGGGGGVWWLGKWKYRVLTVDVTVCHLLLTLPESRGTDWLRVPSRVQGRPHHRRFTVGSGYCWPLLYHWYDWVFWGGTQKVVYTELKGKWLGETIIILFSNISYHSVNGFCQISYYFSPQ